MHASWRWAYYIGIIYAVVVLTGTFICYFPPSRPQHDYEKSRWQEFKELDFIGLGIFSAGLTIFLVGVTYLGRKDYSVPLVASTITIGAIVFALASLRLHHPQEPHLPVQADGHVARVYRPPRHSLGRGHGVARHRDAGPTGHAVHVSPTTQSRSASRLSRPTSRAFSADGSCRPSFTRSSTSASRSSLRWSSRRHSPPATPPSCHRIKQPGWRCSSSVSAASLG